MHKYLLAVKHSTNIEREQKALLRKGQSNTDKGRNLEGSVEIVFKMTNAHHF